MKTPQQQLESLRTRVKYYPTYKVGGVPFTLPGAWIESLSKDLCQDIVQTNITRLADEIAWLEEKENKVAEYAKDLKDMDGEDTYDDAHKYGVFSGRYLLVRELLTAKRKEKAEWEALKTKE